MLRRTLPMVIVGLTLAFWSNAPETVSAQAPVAVTAYYPASPTIARVPVRYGLFGRRVITRPAVVYPVQPVVYSAPVAPVPVTTYYAPAVQTSVIYPAAPVYYSPLPTPLYWRP